MKEDLNKYVAQAEPYDFTIQNRVAYHKNQAYYVIVSKEKGSHPKIWRNIAFTDDIMAQLFFDQEAFAIPSVFMPNRYSIERIHNRRMEESKDIVIYDYPKELNLVMNAGFDGMGISVKMKIHRGDNADTAYYTGRFFTLGFGENNEVMNMNDNFDEDDCEKQDRMIESQSQMFGIRLRPGCFSPERKSYISMRADGIPGLWYISIGERREKLRDRMRVYREKL